MSMKNSNYTIGNQTCDLLACSTVPQSTVPPDAPLECPYCPISLQMKFENGGGVVAMMMMMMNAFCSAMNLLLKFFLLFCT